MESYIESTTQVKEHKNNLSNTHCPKHYHMSYNCYNILGNMTVLSFEVIGIESKKKYMNILWGWVNKSTPETKHDTKQRT